MFTEVVSVRVMTAVDEFVFPHGPSELCLVSALECTHREEQCLAIS